MGSGYRFPQALSLSDFVSKIRDPSFSSYLNDDDGRVEVKLAELTQLGSDVDGEIGAFRADKYFNERLELETEKPDENVLISVCTFFRGSRSGKWPPFKYHQGLILP